MVCRLDSIELWFKLAVYSDVLETSPWKYPPEEVLQEWKQGPWRRHLTILMEKKKELTLVWANSGALKTLVLWSRASHFPNQDADLPVSWSRGLSWVPCELTQCWHELIPMPDLHCTMCPHIFILEHIDTTLYYANSWLPHNHLWLWPNLQTNRKSECFKCSPATLWTTFLFLWKAARHFCLLLFTGLTPEVFTQLLSRLFWNIIQSGAKIFEQDVLITKKKKRIHLS